ncbi:MAG TPA: T9SS type A sorting domain-containing protein, partial [Arachidicoccus sp.]|nr:T9SS type A sorting domain-containing protein [Arachidicoccus sp.]
SSGLLVYPNPVHSELSIQAPVQLSLHPRILILDLNGRVLLRKKLTAAYSKVNVSGLAAGIYLLKYEDDQHHLAVRFVKK